MAANSQDVNTSFNTLAAAANYSWVAGLVIGLLVLIGIIVALIFFARRQQKRKAPSDASGGIDNPTHQQSFDIERPLPIDLNDFPSHVQKLHRDSDYQFSAEFQLLQNLSPKHAQTASELSANRLKNRFTNILPFDHSRVKLIPIDDDEGEGSDYINANFMPGYVSMREFIAAQGPMKSTLDDFWRMIWEQNVSIIVMVTNLQERGREKCYQYWPNDQESVFYGDVQVNLISESSLNYYVLRILEIRLGGKTHKMFQAHFNAWPDFGCPDEPGTLLDFVEEIRKLYDRLRAPLGPEEQNRMGPILVHCSAGVGRTGTFIVVDHLLKLIRRENTVDIFGIILNMRNYRGSMVQSEMQYIFVHECVKLAIEKKMHLIGRQNGYKDDHPAVPLEGNGEALYMNQIQLEVLKGNQSTNSTTDLLDESELINFS